MCAYVWEINISHNYLGPKTQFADYLIERISLYCDRILSLLNKHKLSIEEVTEILHDEKVINGLVIILSKPDDFPFYENIENIIEDFESDPLDIEHYKVKISYFTCKFNWLLVDTINWTGGETFWHNIYGKRK